FAPLQLLIVRARSIALFEYPSGDLIATHSFGWVDGVSVTYNQRTNVISLLVRHQSDNPWTADVSTLQLHNIFPTKDGAGFVFPPVATAGISTPHGALRCPDVVLGRYGTAVWISPQERTMVVDEASDLLSKETLVAAAFPGPLNVDSPRVTAVKMFTNSLNNWTALDYDEEHGRVALGSSFGKEQSKMCTKDGVPSVSTCKVILGFPHLLGQNVRSGSTNRIYESQTAPITKIYALIPTDLEAEVLKGSINGSPSSVRLNIISVFLPLSLYQVVPIPGFRVDAKAGKDAANAVTKSVLLYGGPSRRLGAGDDENCVT
ncbi:hypothetical protein CPB85DRAFT_1522498, partial [Mucidula mucida]